MRYRQRHVQKPKRRPSPTAAKILNFRVPLDLYGRLDRLLRMMAPRILAMTGREASRSDMIRAVLLRGVEFSEREFGLTEPVDAYTLIEDDDDEMD